MDRRSGEHEKARPAETYSHFAIFGFITAV
jgi:hypothetical protein